MFCIKCGKEIVEDSNFCSNCGNEVNPIKKETVSAPTEESAKIEPKKESNKIGIYLLSLICIILAGILLFQNIPKKTEKSEDAYLKVVETEVKDKIDKNENIPPAAKEIAKSTIDKVDSKEELDKAIDTISDKVTELGAEKEKIDNLVKDLESYKNTKELKSTPALNTLYTKFIDFIDSLKKSLNLTNVSADTPKPSKDNTSENKTE